MQPGTVHDLPGVYRVCLLTGAAGADATTLHDDPDLLGHLWAGPYVAFPDAVTRVLHDEHGVAGYCLAVPDTRAFEEWVERVWLPPLRERHPLGSGSTPADAAVVERLHHPTSADAGLLAAHPAHLHVDLLPRLQGRGWGRRVVESVLEGLDDGRRHRRAPGRGRGQHRCAGVLRAARLHRAGRPAGRPLLRQATRVRDLRSPSAGRGTAAGRPASAPRSGSRTSRRASPRRAPSPRTARRCRGHRGRGTPGPRR